MAASQVDWSVVTSSVVANLMSACQEQFWLEGGYWKGNHLQGAALARPRHPHVRMMGDHMHGALS